MSQNTNYGIYKNPQLSRLPITGNISFTGVTRDTDPDGTILSVEYVSKPNNNYTISNMSILVADNTAIYNNTLSGATYNNVSAYIINFKVNLSVKTIPPEITATPILNLTGTGLAIVNNIAPFELNSSADCVNIAYAVVVYGDTQKDSNDLIEQIFTPASSIFGGTTTSGFNFVLNFSN